MVGNIPISRFISLTMNKSFIFPLRKQLSRSFMEKYCFLKYFFHGVYYEKEGLIQLNLDSGNQR